jgi:hypothetical protein
MHKVPCSLQAERVKSNAINKGFKTEEANKENKEWRTCCGRKIGT